jgi:hypothetical protein
MKDLNINITYREIIKETGTFEYKYYYNCLVQFNDENKSILVKNEKIDKPSYSSLLKYALDSVLEYTGKHAKDYRTIHFNDIKL